MVGEPRSNTLVRRLHEGAKAFEAERFADARTALGPVVKEAPELPEGRELMGLTLYRLGKWKEAIEHLESFRELAGSTEQHPVLADAHRALGNWADVDALWAELGKHRRALNSSWKVASSSRAKADQGDLTSAIRLLEQNWKPPKRPMGHHLRRALRWLTCTTVPAEPSCSRTVLLGRRARSRPGRCPAAGEGTQLSVTPRL